MSVDRSTRNALAALLMVAALFVAMNQVVASAPLLDWWLPLVLFVLGAVLVFAPSISFGRAQPDEAPDLPASGVRTYQVAAHQVPRLQTMTIRPDPESAEYTMAISPATPTQAAGPDDLTIIRGIGPKSAAALKAAGIDSFHKLADSSDETIRAALVSAKVRLVGDIDTWSEQAAFAARADWEGLRGFIAKHQSATGD